MDLAQLYKVAQIVVHHMELVLTMYVNVHLVGVEKIVVHNHA